MGKIIEGKKIPTFKADATNDSVFNLENNKKNLVIYFIPKIILQGALLREKILETFTRSLKIQMLRSLAVREKA